MNRRLAARRLGRLVGWASGRKEVLGFPLFGRIGGRAGREAVGSTKALELFH